MPKPMGFKHFVNVDYTQSGDDQLAYQAKKRHQHIPTGNTGEGVETEALTVQQRLAKSRQFKKIKAKVALGRKRAERKIASTDVLKKRAKKQARNIFLKKITKGMSKDELSLARRAEIEKRLDKMGPRIDKLARKLLPTIRKGELEKKRGGQKKSDD